MTAALKDLSLQRYYDALFEMHGTAGWRYLVEDIEGMIEATNRLDGVANDAELNFRKGELNMMRWLKAHAEIVEKTYNAKLAAESGEEEAEATAGVAKVIG